MDSAQARYEVLSAMYPTLPSQTVKQAAVSARNLQLASAQCAALLHPRLTPASIRALAQRPQNAVAEIQTAAQEAVDLVGAEVYDVPNADEYTSIISVVPSDTTSWDHAVFDSLASVPSSTHSLPDMKEPDVRWVRDASNSPKTDRPGGSSGTPATPLLTANHWEEFDAADEEAVELAVAKYADVFDPESMKCSLARELYLRYHTRDQEVNEILPQVLPFLRKVVVGQIVIPKMDNRHVDLPLIGRVPFTTETTRVTSADIPDDGAVINVSCQTCFRVRLRQVKFELEPCRFTYVRGGVRRKGILEIIVKRAHLRLGMDVHVSAYGKRTAEVYLARMRLKKFSLHAKMKYSPLVNAFLNVARNFIKNAIEEEMTKSLLGHHALDGL